MTLFLEIMKSLVGTEMQFLGDLCKSMTEQYQRGMVKSRKFEQQKRRNDGAQ